MQKVTAKADYQIRIWYQSKAQRMMLIYLLHICASVNWVSIGPGNGLSPVWSQAITWINADLLFIGY